MQNKLKEKLKGSKKIVVLVLGSDLRGDDEAGILVGKELEKKIDASKVQVLYGFTAPENFTGQIKKINPTHIIMVDAAQMDKSPGDVDIIEKDSIDCITFSTHSLPIKIMVDYMKESIDAESVIIGIEPKDMGFDKKVSPEIKKAVKKTAKIILDVVKDK
ncbi:MAG: hydrogenase maturation peptidase HycI [Armatimonadota bacterium]